MIGRGFHAVQAALSIVPAKAGAHLDATFACAHHADGSTPFNVADHPWRQATPRDDRCCGEPDEARFGEFLDRR